MVLEFDQILNYCIIRMVQEFDQILNYYTIRMVLEFDQIFLIAGCSLLSNIIYPRFLQVTGPDCIRMKVHRSWQPRDLD